MPPPSIEDILRSDARLAPVVREAEHFRLQARLGVVVPAAQGPDRIEWSSFRPEAEYFYPASTVKLLAAVAGLEHLNELARQTGLPIDESTALSYDPQFDQQEPQREDPTNLEGGAITVAHEIRKLFLVSDNEAYNRLYELVGQEGLGRFSDRHGLHAARIVHRLSERRSAEENLLSPRIELRGEGFSHQLPAWRSTPLPPPTPMPGLEVGKGYLEDGQRIDRPLELSAKNRISLADLATVLVPLARPDLTAEGPSYDLSEAQLELLREAMSQTPRESRNPLYDPGEYPDHWVKFLLPGIARVVPKEEVRIWNKIGRAYGFSTENAYVEHLPTGRGFFLAVTLYTNEDGVLNDDLYEYESVADPFLEDLGEAVARALWTN